MTVTNQTPEMTAIAIQDWLIHYLAEILERSSEEIDPEIPFDRYGLDSASAVVMTGDLERWLGIEVDPTLPYDCPTIALLSEELAESNPTGGRGDGGTGRED